MSNIKQLITDHIDIWTAAETEKKSGRGRASSNAGSVYGIRKLRELILELAVRGKLVPQDTDDEPASELLKRVQTEKAKLVAEGQIKKDKPLAAISENDKPFKTPKGWSWVRLGSALLKITDGTHRSPTNVATGDFKYISAKNIKPWGIDFSEVTYVSKDVHEEIYSRCDPVLGDILYIKDGATTGIATTNTLVEPFSMLSSVALLKPSVGTDNQFLLKAMTAPFFYAEMRSEMTGVAITRVTLAKLNYAIIPLPPLAEQHRIVAKVDELMALCDQLEAQHSNAADAHEQLVSHLLGTFTQATVHPEPVEGCSLTDNPSTGSGRTEFEENWQRIATHFDTLFTTEASIDALKQTLLQLAVMGKLVPQDPKDEPASELLKRIQVEKAKLIAEGKIKKDKPLAAVGESPFDLPLNWEWARFPEIGKFGRGKSKHRPRNDPKLFNPGIYPLVQTGEVARADNLISEYHSKYSDIGLAQSKMWPAGTMCITIAANIADSAILGFDACFPDSVVGFVPYMPLKDARYFLSFMKTAREDLLKFAPATAQKNINLEILESVLIPIPPLNEISRIVAKVDELMTLCERLKSRITDAKQCQQKLADVLVEQALID